MNDPQWEERPPAPEKKMTTGKVVVIVVATLAALALGLTVALVALVGGAAHEVDKELNKPEKSQEEPADPSHPDAPTTPPDNQENPPKEDVSVGPVVDEGYDTYTAEVTYKNNSSKTSDYWVEFSYYNDGTKVGDDADATFNVKPGETVKSELMPYGSVNDAVDTVKVESVERVASN